MKILILGGTTEASALCAALAGRADVAPVLSLAGRTATPVLPAVPYRVGGFGGMEGLAAYLLHERIVAVIDATHPFATRISGHAVAAASRCRVPLVAFSRPPWDPGPGDRWTEVPDLEAAAAEIGGEPQRVLLTIGRLGLAAFRAAARHHFVIRTIDPPHPADLPRSHALLFDRGPFRLTDEAALMRRERIDVLVTKNSGGAAAAAKLEAARALGLRVVVVARPAPPGPREDLSSLGDVLAWIEAHHDAPSPFDVPSDCDAP